MSGEPTGGHLFPRFHVRPPRGYLNDPNGPVFLDGRYHLYFQDRVNTDTTTPVLWGHASSADLVDWTHHRPAIAPHPVLADRDGCWSGNTVVDDHGRVRAFYSGLRHDHPYQTVLSAVSLDGGYSFGEPVPVVADPAADERIVTYRDPFVWRDSGSWAMIVGAGDADGVASVRLYRSADLEAWSFVGLIARSPRLRGVSGQGGPGQGGLDTGEMWECPQLVEVDGEPVLLAGAWTERDGTMAVYAITGVALDGTAPTGDQLRFVPLDHGPDFYAASVLRDSPAGSLVWGWAREARDHAWCVEDGWSGALTLPRTMRRTSSGALALSPAPGLDRLRGDGGQSVGPEGVGGLPAQLELAITAPSGGEVALRIDFSATERLMITVDRRRAVVIIDRDRSSTDPRAAGGVTEIPDAFDPSSPDPDVRAFLDGSVLELFTSAGRVATLRYYPTTPPPYTLGVTGDHGAAVPAAAVRVWQLRDAQPVLHDRVQRVPVFGP